MRLPAPAVLALLLALAPCGCSWSVSRAGSPGFLTRQIAWTPGRTTLRDVTHQLGPPDWIRGQGDGLLVVYRFHREEERRFALEAWLRWFTQRADRVQDGTLVAAFDARDRLLWWGRDAGP